MQVLDHRIQVQRLEFCGVVKIFPHGVGLRRVLVQDTQLELVGPPIGVGRGGSGGVFARCMGERALGFVDMDSSGLRLGSELMNSLCLCIKSVSP